MEDYVREMILRELDRIRELIASRRCVLSMEEALRLLGLIAHEPLSLADTITLLNAESDKMGISHQTGLWNRTKLYDAIKDGTMPCQHHVRGFKEGRWYRDEVLMALTRLKKTDVF